MYDILGVDSAPLFLLEVAVLLGSAPLFFLEVVELLGSAPFLFLFLDLVALADSCSKTVATGKKLSYKYVSIQK